jgi:hypothetical protein
MRIDFESERTAVGNCGFGVTRIDDEHRPGSIAYSLSTRYRERGLAAKALLDFVFQKLRLHRVFVRTGADSIRYRRRMERLGMSRKAHSRERLTDRNIQSEGESVSGPRVRLGQATCSPWIAEDDSARETPILPGVVPSAHRVSARTPEQSRTNALGANRLWRRSVDDAARAVFGLISCEAPRSPPVRSADIDFEGLTSKVGPGSIYADGADPHR